MGCWNGTCMISNLPIISGEKIKLVILSSVGSDIDDFIGAGYCEATGLMAPTYLPIEGEYNDYGMIEEIVDDWNVKFINESLKKAWDEIEVEGEKLTEFSLENILEGIERGSLKLKKNGGLTKSNLSFVMIRKDIWDGICKEYIGAFRNTDQKEIAKGKYRISGKEYCKRKGEANLAHIAKLNEFKASGDDIQALRYSMLEMRDACIFREDRILRGHTHEYANTIEAEGADASAIINAWTELVLVHSFLDGVRKSWMIQQGAGNQSAEWELYKMLNKMTNNICNKKIKQYDE